MRHRWAIVDSWYVRRFPSTTPFWKPPRLRCSVNQVYEKYPWNQLEFRLFSRKNLSFPLWKSPLTIFLLSLHQTLARPLSLSVSLCPPFSSSLWRTSTTPFRSPTRTTFSMVERARSRTDLRWRRSPSPWRFSFSDSSL